MLSGDKIYSLADNATLFGKGGTGGPIFTSMQSVIDFAKSSQLIKTSPTATSLLDGALIP
jgi:hypothetical protein